jgi:Vitamin B6 photo-protection and homoeostasis
LGTSLFPEAKMYRLLADFLNDLALIFDVLSPHLDELAAMFTSYRLGSGLRITALCISGSLRALCGVVAGGSKAALTLHFATSSTNGPGDIGDLNAKDGSKETVLALLGLLASVIYLCFQTKSKVLCASVALLFCHM